MPSRLSDQLLASDLVPVAGVRAAVARQAVYGGALDTALLELGAIDEATLWGALAAATELGVPDRALCEAPQKLVEAGRLGRAQPRRRLVGALPRGAGRPQGRRAADPVRRAGGARGDRGRDRRARHSVRARRGAGDLDRGRSAGDLRPADGAAAGAPVRAGGRRAAGAALAGCAHARPATGAAGTAGREFRRGSAHRHRRRPRRLRVAAARRPAQAEPRRRPPRRRQGAGPRQGARFPALIERLERGSDVQAAHAALVAITKQDFGTEAEAVGGWWKKHEDDDRIDGCSRGCRTRPPRSAPPPSRSCAR